MLDIKSQIKQTNQGIQTSIAKIPYISVIFQGGPDPLPSPLWIRACFYMLALQSKKKGKDQEPIQSSTTPDSGYQWESYKFTTRHQNREPRGQPYPSRRTRKHDIKDKTEKNINESQKKHRLGTVSKEITGGLKLVSRRANLTLSSDVDQDS